MRGKEGVPLAVGLVAGFLTGVVVTILAGGLLVGRYGTPRTGVLAELEGRVESSRAELLACKSDAEDKIFKLSASLQRCEGETAGVRQACEREKAGLDADYARLVNDFHAYRDITDDQTHEYLNSPEFRRFLGMFPMTFKVVPGQTVGLESLLRFKLESAAGKEIYLRVLPSDDGIINVLEGESFNVSRGDFLFNVRLTRQGREHQIELALNQQQNRDYFVPAITDLLCRKPSEREILK